MSSEIHSEIRNKIGSEKMTTYGYYNRDNICDRCKDENRVTEKSKLKKYNANREYNENGDWTGRWLCKHCLNYDYDRKHDGRNNLLKSVADRRTGNLNPNSNAAKGDNFEELTCKLYEVDNLNIKYDNFEMPFDHSVHPILGILQTKGRYYDSYERRWDKDVTNEHNKEFDNLIFYCASSDGGNILRIYIFPKNEIINRNKLIIYKEPKGLTRAWYEKYRIKDKDIIEKANKLWRERKWR